MPRAYYRPFTLYEEIVGFHGARRNAYILSAFFFAGIIIKVFLMYNYSPASNQLVKRVEEMTPEQRRQYEVGVEYRAKMAQAVSEYGTIGTSDARLRRQREQEFKQHCESRGPAPPA